VTYLLFIYDIATRTIVNCDLVKYG